MTKTFKVPFAAQGDRVSIPDEVQADGTVSYAQGYGSGYGLDPNEDPTAMNIEREKMNGVFHDITEAIGEMQTFGAAQWNSDAQSYPMRGLVYHKEKLWQSRIENNKDEPAVGTAWVELKADLTASDVDAYSKDESNQRFQSKGNYQLAGDYATNSALNNGLGQKIDKSSIVQNTGNSTSSVMSQNAVTQAIKSSMDIDTIYPIGVVIWFAKNKNPNNLFPRTRWSYIGENKTIRLASGNGSNVLSTGGRDTKSLSINNIPRHSHYFSGNTNSAGGHNHSRGNMNITGYLPSVIVHGSNIFGGAFARNGQSQPGVEYTDVWENLTTFDASRTWTGSTSWAGDHTHSISGNISETGSGDGFDVTNAYIMLMGWYRTA
ncbi:phage baseplate protein [Xenorhabdus lircayensis]|uniref:Phage tail protein n=1 Tax=Xenorhabdus lircayensis TaxID=2763499 RepID=A0ABS0U2V8_9GAMM|nr:phage tail protein [Xenorhabdus lircayensis]MBI6548224.1 phage tail protein [Xenorhabdus lircayensis]